MEFALGSKSILKGVGVQGALDELRYGPLDHMIETESGVPKQPEGEQILNGARNRALAVHREFPNAFAIAVENGLRRTEFNTVDVAVVVIIAPDGSESIAESEAVPFPAHVVDEARRRGFDNVTAGQVLSESAGSRHDDPHLYLTGGKRSRSVFIKETVVRALAKWAKKPANSTAVYRITIGKVVRDLPIREVAPGIRVALFNLLGDWELTEEIGAELAKLIPTGTQALLMPDGKALALLHVMGRIAKLPTFVARKELKPYMAAPALEVSLRSITTDKTQRLFLGRDYADRLAGLKVTIVDDVVSTGGTLLAVRKLLAEARATECAVMAAFTEGEPRTDVIALGRLPLFKS